MSLVSNLLSALTRAAPAARAAVPYSAGAKSLVAASLAATTIGFVRPIWFISVGMFSVLVAVGGQRRVSSAPECKDV